MNDPALPPIQAPASQVAQSTAAPSTGSGSIVTQLEDIGRDALADLEAKAVPEIEPIAQTLVDELIGKLPFGTLLEPLANMVLQSVAAKLQAHPAVAGAS